MTQFRLLAGVPENDVRRLLATAARRRFARGEVVFHRDDRADTLHLVSKGRFGVLLESALLAVRGPGESFGELALLTARAKRTATVRALEPAETFAVDEASFADLRASFPAVDRMLFASLAAELRRTNEALEEALTMPVGQRVRRRLLELARVYADGDGEVTIPLTQSELAELAGTTRGTVNEILRAEQERGAVRLGRGRIVLTSSSAGVNARTRRRA